ncbi:MAG: globin [Lishizhenia sp.]
MTLYEILGEQTIKELVNRFYERVLKDEKIKHLFTNDIEVIKDKQFRFLCQFLGGPQYYIEKYGHPKMRMRHLPHAISEEGKEAWLGCMKKAIDSLNLGDNLSRALYDCFPKIAQHMVNS